MYLELFIHVLPQSVVTDVHLLIYKFNQNHMYALIIRWLGGSDLKLGGVFIFQIK